MLMCMSRTVILYLLNLQRRQNLEYLFVHGINDARIVVARAKPVDAPPVTYVGLFPEGLQELKFPGSVSTEGWNINQDGSVVGHYDTADGRRHGFIARPITDTTAPGEAAPVVPTPPSSTILLKPLMSPT